MILLFSADAVMKHSITTCLFQAGYKVVCSSFGSKALELIRSEHTVLVILDITLPGHNSLAIIRSLRQREFGVQSRLQKM